MTAHQTRGAPGKAASASSRARPTTPTSRAFQPSRASHLRQAVAQQPRVALAVKSAVAAGLAWLCVLPIGGIADHYPYYAPFGAVIAVSSTTASSFRSAARTMGALALAAAVATLARLLPLPEVAAIAAVVLVGTLLSGWRPLADKGSWVPVSGVFILLVGAGDPAHYVAAYVGLTSLGAAVGVALNTALPPLPLTPTSVALKQLREALGDQLADVADGLSGPSVPDEAEWQRRRRRLDPLQERVRSLVHESAEARRANWRARRWARTADHQDAQAQSLERLATLVNEVLDLVVERERADVRGLALGPELRPHAGAALAAMAHLLRADAPDEVRAALRRLCQCLDLLRDATRRAWREQGEDRFTAAAIVVALDRATEHVTGAPAAAAGLTATDALRPPSPRAGT